MVRKHYVSLALSALLIASTPAQATGWTAWAKGNFTGSTEYAHSIKTQKTTTLSGGGVRVRWGNLGTIRPVNITPPSFSVGCNGMDFSLGSISFMNFDEIVEKLKMVASAAPAFAFKMAIDTVCSQCATIMQDLEEIINMINNMSLDACKMAENIGNGVGQALGSTVADAGGGLFSDSYAAAKGALRDAAPYAAAVTNFVNNLDDITIKSRFYGSFLEYVKEHSSNQTVKDFIPYLRATVGDFGVVNKEEEPSIKVYAGNKGNLAKMYSVLLEPDGVSSYNYVTATNSPAGSKFPEDITFTVNVDVVSQNNALHKVFYDDMINVLGKMGPQGSKLTASDLTLIRLLPKNGYKILNAVYALGDAAQEKEKYLLDYAKYVALHHLTSSLLNSYSEALQTIADYSKSLTIREMSVNAQKYMDFMKLDIHEAMKETKKLHSEWLKKYPGIDQNKYQKQLEQQIKNSLK